MGNKYVIDLEKQIEERDRQDLIDLLYLVSGSVSNRGSEYEEDAEQIARFGFIAERINSYFTDLPDLLVESSIDEDKTGGLITIIARGTMDLNLTEEIKWLMSSCTRMDVSPHNNGIIKLDFNFLGFQKKRVREVAL